MVYARAEPLKTEDEVVSHPEIYVILEFFGAERCRPWTYSRVKQSGGSGQEERYPRRRR